MSKRLKKLSSEISFLPSDFAADPKQIRRHTIAVLSADRVEERRIFMRRKFYKAVLIAAAVTALISATVFAAGITWNDKMIEWLQPTEKQMEQLGDAADLPEAAITQNGVTVTVKQTLADSHNLYVLYEIEAPQDFVFTDETELFHEGVGADYAYDESVIGMGGGSSEVIAQSGNKRTVMLYTNDTGTLKGGCDMELNLKDFGYWEKNEDGSYGDFKTLIAGEWNLKWRFDGEPAEQKTIAVNRKIDITGENEDVFTVLEISPMSVWMTVEGDDVLMALKPVIRFRNGEEIAMEPMNDGASTYVFQNFLNEDNRKGKNVIGYRFGKIIDLADIESVTVGNVTVNVQP